MDKCFAWVQDMYGKYYCKALTNTCNGHDDMCPFYKTDAQLKASRDNANKRLRDLAEYEQKSIASKYFSDKRPWLH